MNHDDAKAALLAKIAAAPAPTREQTQRRTWLALALGGLCAVAMFVGVGGIHAGTRPTMFVVVSALALAALAFRASWVAGVVLFAIAVNYALTGTTHVALHGDLVCAAITGAFTLVLGGAMLAAFRQTEPVHPERRGFELALSATTLAAAFVFVVCEHDEARHFVLAHVLTAALLAALLALVARRVVAIR